MSAAIGGLSRDCAGPVGLGLEDINHCLGYVQPAAEEPDIARIVELDLQLPHKRIQRSRPVAQDQVETAGLRHLHNGLVDQLVDLDDKGALLLLDLHGVDLAKAGQLSLQTIDPDLGNGTLGRIELVLLGRDFGLLQSVADRLELGVQLIKTLLYPLCLGDALWAELEDLLTIHHTD